MTPKEAKAYRLALLWISLTKKLLPDDSSVSAITLPKGDPRKGYLFKQCWKLARETAGLLEESDYKYYFAAQLGMLKNVKRDNGHAHVGHNVFVGDKAWVRWKIWKKKFDDTLAARDLPPLISDENNIIKEIDRTFVFLQKNSASKFDLDDLKLWVNSGKVSLAYICLSPKVQKLTDNLADFNFDPHLFRKKLSGRVQDHFQNVFSSEF